LYFWRKKRRVQIIVAERAELGGFKNPGVPE